MDSSFLLQLVRYGFVSTVLHIYSTNTFILSLTTFLCLATISLLGRQWLSLVTKHAPEPYLDEVFHIPQAQVYCDGKWDVWDDKITTPPGLYVLTILANKLTGFSCEVEYLRLFNVEVISYLALAAITCRARVERQKTTKRLGSPYAIWTGMNVALFPVLFFFSGLYYTDVISTFVVLLAYSNHLGRVSRKRSSLVNDLYTLVLGLLALCMRQTNIFWVVVYMGGLEAVHSFKAPEPRPRGYVGLATDADLIKWYTWRYSLGDIHDPPVDEIFYGLLDLGLCVFSIGIAAVFNLGTVLRRVWPQIVVLASFVAFIMWNGGVVLGDKSNHVATLHLAQMLYIWPLFAFFSAPLFIPQLGKLVTCIFESIANASPQTVPPTKNRGEDRPEEDSAAPNPFAHSRLSLVLRRSTILLLAGASLAAALVVRYNTVIHPFTLADNRHYMFYVFRYTILRAPWLRYALIPVYVGSGYLSWAALRGNAPPAEDRWWLWARSADGLSTIQTTTLYCANEDRPRSVHRVRDSTTPPPTSTVLILLLATALSLVTAPLVEPRYFIIPWVFWRLLVPSQTVVPASVPGAKTLASRYLVPALETAWFLLINAVTMYIFITRPFYWKAPDGTLLDEGRVQRFMW